MRKKLHYFDILHFTMATFCSTICAKNCALLSGRWLSYSSESVPSSV